MPLEAATEAAWLQDQSRLRCPPQPPPMAGDWGAHAEAGLRAGPMTIKDTIGTELEHGGCEDSRS